MPYCETHPVRSGLVPCLIFECRVGLVFFLLFLKTCDYYASRMKLSLCQFWTSSNLFRATEPRLCRVQFSRQIQNHMALPFFILICFRTPLRFLPRYSRRSPSRSSRILIRFHGILNFSSKNHSYRSCMSSLSSSLIPSLNQSSRM